MNGKTDMMAGYVSFRDRGSSSVTSSSLGGSSVKSHIALPDGKLLTVLQMTELLKEILPCQDLKHNLTLYRRCFKANDAIQRFREHYAECTNDGEAIAFGRALQRSRIIVHCCDHSKPFQSGMYFFRLQCYHQPHILNSYRIASDRITGDAMTLIDGLSAILLQIEKDSKTRNQFVDYNIASRSKYFPIFENIAASLQGHDLGTLNETTRLAVAINAYNIMIKYAFIKLGVGTTKSTRTQFFSGVKMNFGGDILSFNDLEHGVIRGNRPPPGISSSAPFSLRDHRLRLAISQSDYRIHWCLDCFPVPSHPIRIRPETLSADMRRCGVLFLSRNSNLWTSCAPDQLFLSKIFLWYSSDFDAPNWRELLALLEMYACEEKKKDLQVMLKKQKPPAIKYCAFDWGVAAENFEAFTMSAIKPNQKWARR